MGKEPIELLKPYDPKKLSFPACMQQKFDGVPLFFRSVEIEGTQTVVPITRQNELVFSVNHILPFMEEIISKTGGWVIGEMYRPDTPFKDISGMVRKRAPAPSLVCMVFDADIANSGGTWFDRQVQFRTALYKLAMDKYYGYANMPVKYITNTIVYTESEADRAYDELCREHPNAEGVVYHSMSGKFQPGKRGWHGQKRKLEPTIDLQVIGYDEAEDQYGEPKGMVGRVWLSYAGETIGAGPGALTHAERIELWRTRKTFGEPHGIAEIKYMTDPSYKALRQARFVRWRPDKEQADA